MHFRKSHLMGLGFDLLSSGGGRGPYWKKNCLEHLWKKILNRTEEVQKKKKSDRESPNHAPQMINDRPLSISMGSSDHQYWVVN